MDRIGGCLPVTTWLQQTPEKQSAADGRMGERPALRPTRLSQTILNVGLGVSKVYADYRGC